MSLLSSPNTTLVSFEVPLLAQVVVSAAVLLVFLPRRNPFVFFTISLGLGENAKLVMFF